MMNGYQLKLEGQECLNNPNTCFTLNSPNVIKNASCNSIMHCLYLSHFLCARNLFSSFDTAKQGRVTLDFNQFVFCSEYITLLNSSSSYTFPLMKNMENAFSVNRLSWILPTIMCLKFTLGSSWCNPSICCCREA